MLEIECKGKHNFINNQILAINFFVNKFVVIITRNVLLFPKTIHTFAAEYLKKGGKQEKKRIL